jgi:hypothetical protein
MHLKKIQGSLEIAILIVAIISFSYLLSGEAGIIEASEFFPKVCCLETKDGAKCQDMLGIDSALCKNTPVMTECNQVNECKKGCCYDSESGICSLNSPKSLCEKNKGIWTGDSLCNIQECSVGCCILGEQAILSTEKECSNLAEQYKFSKNFRELDEDGSCFSKSNLNEFGACIIKNEDKDCSFINKEKCIQSSGEFYGGLLCTNKDLNSKCKKTSQTACIEGKEDVYFLDSCGNRANIYDFSKLNEQEYWDKVYDEDSSCASSSDSCGNCDYAGGSMCEVKSSGKFNSDYAFCKNLNCKNGRKNGESWCISDYNPIKNKVAPVGSRFYRASCVFGDIVIEPCSDFNQEVCIEARNEFNGTEAMCRPNAWRSCLSANNKNNYEEIKKECDKYDDCVMFLDAPGNQIYSKLPGFNKEVSKEMQGAVGDFGKNMNKVGLWCVPKYSPGMVFWSDIETKKNSMGYGGSIEESKAICSLGNFNCISQEKKRGATDDWDWKETTESCGNPGEDNTKLTEALNERCRMLGPCGLSVNIAGELGEGESKSNFQRIDINEKGDTSKVYTPLKGYDFSEEYKSYILNVVGLLKSGSFKEFGFESAPVKGNYKSSSNSIPVGNSLDLNQFLKDSDRKETGSIATSALSLFGTLSLTKSFAGFLTGAGAKIGLGSFGGTVGWTMAGAIAGYFIGQLIGKSLGYPAGKTQALSYSLAAGGAWLALTASSWTVTTTTWTAGASSTVTSLSFCWVCLIVAVIIIIVTYVLTYRADRFHIISYQCDVWEPPLEGDCNLCNDDLRPCSEYRCRSLGSNCQYFNDNGEPGWCASTEDFSSSSIKPWKEILSSNNSYTEISSSHFNIEGLDKKEVDAWENLIFGIETSKPSQCRIDNVHTEKFEEMKYSFLSFKDNSCLGFNCASENNQGIYHAIALSPYSSISETGGNTLAFAKGENRYFIRCKNYAGQVNEAEFSVDVIRADGRDYSPPVILSFNPQLNYFLKKDTNITEISFYINEPAECKFSSEVNVNYDNMNKSAFCFKNSGQAVLGKWPCYFVLDDLKPGQNKVYIQCKDQPDIIERTDNLRNVNTHSKEYLINVCESGLKIIKSLPQTDIVTGGDYAGASLIVHTEGCSANSSCFYRFSSNESFISFLNTYSNVHTQPFSSLLSGKNDIEIKCEDEYGNMDIINKTIAIYSDKEPPKITRFYMSDSKLFLFTDENARCFFSNDKTKSCLFSYSNSSLLEGTEKRHVLSVDSHFNYYIKCEDVFGNIEGGCFSIKKI